LSPSLLEKLSHIALQLTRSASLETILNWAVQETQQLLRVERTLIYRFGLDDSGTVLAESVETGWISILGQTFFADRSPSAITTTCPRVAIAHPYASEQVQLHSNLLVQLQAQTSLTVPIFLDLKFLDLKQWEEGSAGTSQPGKQEELSTHPGCLWGLLIVQQCSYPRQWQELERQVLQYVASQLTIALQRADLVQTIHHYQTEHRQAVEELRSRQRELFTLHRISEITLNTELLKAAFQDIVEEISSATGFPIAAIELYDAARQVMVFAGMKGVPLPPESETLTVPVAQTLSGTVATTAKAIVKTFQPNESKNFENNASLNQIGVKTFVCVPMIVNQQVIGVLSLAHPEMVQVDAPFLQWMSSLASFIASLTQRKQTEAALREQAEREQLVGAIAHRIRQSLDLDEVLQTAVTEVRQLLRTERVIIFRFEPDWSGMVLTESVANGWQSILGLQILDTHFLKTQGKHYQAGDIQLIENVNTAGFSQCHRDFLEQLQVKAKLVVPILQGEQLWGLLVVHQCSAPRRWQTWEGEFLKQLADQLALTIQQSELYQRMQHFNAALERQVKARTAELQLASELEATLKRITDKVRDSLDERQILQTAVQELAKGLGVDACNAALFDLEQGISTICYEYTTTVTPSQGRISRMADFPELYDQLLQEQHFQFCSLLPNPTRGHVAMLACPISDDQGVLGDLWLINQSYYVFSQQDIRLVQQVANQCAIALRQSQLFQSAQAQVRELELLNRLKDDFLSTVSHELRTPMSSIKMATQMLDITLFKDEHGHLRDANNPAALTLHPASFKKATQYFRILDSECQREIALINDLLDLVRLDVETEPRVMTQVSLSDWIIQIAEPFAKRTQQQNQHFNLDISAQIPFLQTDCSALERILIELLHNACKYTPANETITLAVRLTGEEAGEKGESKRQKAEEKAEEKAEGKRQKAEKRRAKDGISPLLPPPPLPISQPLPHLPVPPSSTHRMLLISVSNSGVEIPEGERDRIFDKFYRIPNNDPWKHGGTGLGLALVKKLVERINGKVSVHSQANQTTFTVELPLDGTLPSHSLAAPNPQSPIPNPQSQIPNP
jgi:GAF domain-containing protein